MFAQSKESAPKGRGFKSSPPIGGRGNFDEEATFSRRAA